MGSLDELLAFAGANGRVCPVPQRWNELWEMLPNRQQVGLTWSPPPPLILAAWWDTPVLLKMARLADHIRYAAQHGRLTDVHKFLRSLREHEWAHLTDFGGTE